MNIESNLKEKSKQTDGQMKKFRTIERTKADNQQSRKTGRKEKKERNKI